MSADRLARLAYEEPPHDTGTSSTWVQMTLALMMGYGDGRTSALVNLRDPLHASIVMLSPPDQASRDAHPQMFSWDF